MPRQKVEVMKAVTFMIVVYLDVLQDRSGRKVRGKGNQIVEGSRNLSTPGRWGTCKHTK